MKNSTLLLLTILLFSACATPIPESRTRRDPAPEPIPAEPPSEERVPEDETPKASAVEPEEEAADEPEPELPRIPPDLLVPSGMELVSRHAELLRIEGDYNGDGRRDVAFLAVSGEPPTVEALRARDRLEADGAPPERRARVILLVTGGDPVLLDPGPVTLLAEISAKPLGAENGEAPGTAPLDLLYLRLENREQQRHLLFSVDRRFGTPYRYLFVTDAGTGFYFRDLEGDGVREVVHVENRLTAAGIEESYLGIYKFVGRELRRHSRVAVVERANDLLETVQEALVSGKPEKLRDRLHGTAAVDRYFPAQGGPALTELEEITFVTVPELRANPFDLGKPEPRVTTEILVVSKSGENIYSVTIGIRFSPETEPRMLLLPSVSPDGD